MTKKPTQTKQKLSKVDKLKENHRFICTKCLKLVQIYGITDTDPENADAHVIIFAECHGEKKISFIEMNDLQAEEDIIFNKLEPDKKMYSMIFDQNDGRNYSNLEMYSQSCETTAILAMSIYELINKALMAGAPTYPFVLPNTL